jgi:quinol monooxygenase YgiN
MRTMLLAAGLVLVLACPVARAQDKEPDVITRLKKAKVEGPFTLVVVFKVKEGKEKNLLEAARPCIAATRKENGCLQYDLQQDVENPRQFMFYERWKNIAALEEHFKTEHLKRLIDNLKELLDGAPKFASFRPTGKE